MTIKITIDAEIMGDRHTDAFSFSGTAQPAARALPGSGWAPGENRNMKDIRLLGAALMEAIERATGPGTMAEVGRPRATALTHVETAVMFGIKAAVASYRDLPDDDE